MTEPLAPATGVRNERGPMISCVRCGYDLRGLPDSGNCPECGLPVARSNVPSVELRHAPPRWLASLSWGARLVLAVPLLTVAYGWFVSGRLPARSLEMYVAPQAALCVAFAAGVWLLTRSQPRFGPSRPALRWTLRVVSLVPLLQNVVLYGLLSGRLTPNSLPGSNADIAMLGLVPMPALMFLHLRGLALRVLNPSLAEHCAIVGVSGSLSFAVSASGMFVRLSPVVEVTAAACVMVMLMWSLLLLTRFTFAFGRAHRASVAAWGVDA